MVKKTNNGKSKSVLEVNKVYVGNCLEVLKTFPDESLDMCVTSPPYWGLRDYGTDGQIWGGDDNCDHDFTKSTRKLHSGTNSEGGLPHHLNASKVDWEVEDAICNKCGAWKGELGLEPTPDMFVDHLCDIFDEIKRVLRPHGSCWVNLGDTYANTGYGKGTGNMQNKNVPGAMIPKVKCDLPQKCLVQIPSRFAIEMTNRGWVLRNELIWHKPSCLPSPIKDRYTVDFEKMFFFTKKPKYYFKQQFEPLVSKIKSSKIPNKEVPYAVQPREKEFIKYRDLPDHQSIREYLEHWRNEECFTIKEIENHFGNSKGHHWFEKDGSYPTVEDWKELKKLLKFDDEYDEVMTTEYEKSSEKTSDSRGRNKRAVWSVSTAKFEGAHFAVYPPELIESPIDAGCPLYVCSECGKPREEIYKTKSVRKEDDLQEVVEEQKDRGYVKQARGYAGIKELQKHGYAEKEFMGYTDCGCDAEFIPGVVLDPFFGSGTTAEVAMKQDKDWVGIELNDNYVNISDKRLKPTIIEKKTREKASEFWG